MNKLKVTYSLSEEAVSKLSYLAQQDARSNSNMLERLISEAYNKLKQDQQ